MSPEKPARKSPARRSAARPASAGFTADERAAMKERAREAKAEARGAQDRAAGERELLARVAEMGEPDRSLATRLHALVLAAAPALLPRTWYGMPAYANADGKVVCFFQNAGKFKSRYATLGFSDTARLDEGAMWPTAFALVSLGEAEAERIRTLVRRAVG